MRLFQLVKQDDAVGLTADFLRQLPRLVVADVAGRRTDQLRDGVTFHIFRHIQPHEGIHGVKQLVCKRFDQFCLAYARGADKDKRDGMFFRCYADAVTANRGGDSADCLILPDNALLQALLQGAELLIFLRADLARGDLRPHLDHTGKIFHRQYGRGLRLQCGDLLI